MGVRTTCLIWWLFIFETSACESNFILWWDLYVHFKIRTVFARRPDCMQLLASKNQAGIMEQIVDEQKIWAHGSNMNHKNAFFHPVVINHPVRSLSMPQQSVFDPMKWCSILRSKFWNSGNKIILVGSLCHCLVVLVARASAIEEVMDWAFQADWLWIETDIRRSWPNSKESRGF